jgi:DNA modification methylase
MAALAGWDLSMLKIEVDDLRLQGFDIELTGFTEAELDKMMPPIEAEDSEKDPDEVPVVPDVAYSKLGQIWCCGPHKIMCGSSTSKADWDALMQGELADIQVCDPPYGVDYSSELAGKIKNDNLKDEEFYKFLLDFYTCSFGVMKAGAAMYVAHADSEGANFRGALKKLGFLLKSCLMWVKSSLVLGRGDFHYRHEPILYSIKPGGARRWYGGRKNTTLQDFGDTPIFQKTEDGRYAIQYGDAILYVNADAVVEEAPSTLLHFDKPKRSPMHPTTKPVRLWEKLIGFNARPGDVIIDGFGGSGTTMIAADRLGLSARLMELDERFSDVICVRYFQFTGRIPVDAKTGESFPKEVIDRLTEKFAQA